MKRFYYPKKNLSGKQKKPKKRQYKEHNHQVAVFQLAKMYENQFPELALLTGSLNGVDLDIKVAKRAKDAGVKAGFPDIHWPIARGQWFGLYVELKTDEGRASAEQLKIAQMLRNEGNLVLFIRGSELAWNNIMKYAKLPRLMLQKKESADDADQGKSV